MTAIDRLPAVGLAELIENAALLARVDRKYILDPSEFFRLVTALPAGARALEIDGSRAFGYRSDYVDTLDYASYLAAARGRRRRHKVRVRTYLDSGESWLEVKTRGPHGITVKDRILCSRALSAGAAAEVGREFIDANLVLAGMSPVGGPLVPTLRSQYKRSTLLLPDGARLTIDRDLAFARLGQPPNASGALRLGPAAIVETKSCGGASDADRMLWRAGIRPVRVSKYATALAALDSRLPANRWRRTLDTWFRPALAPGAGEDSRVETAEPEPESAISYFARHAALAMR